MNQNPLVIAHAQIVEYAHNDIHASQATMDTAERRAYERLLRKLLKLPNRPAVILLHTYSYREVRTTCQSSKQSTSEGLAKHTSSGN